MPNRRPPELRRSWLFVGGGDDVQLDAVSSFAPDVAILELEDFTAPGERPRARLLAADLFPKWRRAGLVAAVRVNPLETADGEADLKAVMKGEPDVVLLPKVAEPEQVTRLSHAITDLEHEYGIESKATEIVPNIELARGLIQTFDICKSSERISGALVASEDMAADLGAERSRDGVELQYVRQRFIVECTAASTMAIDCPYTWTDEEGQKADARFARRLGYRAKSCVEPSHAPIINAVLTPAADDVEQARRIVSGFETAQSQGLGRVEVDGSNVEIPIYMNAKRLIARWEQLRDWSREA